MSWKEKSGESFKATNKLITEGLYNTSVHCSYYSCVQLMYHTLEKYLNMDQTEIKKESNESQSSHVWLINKVTQLLKQLTSKKDARNFSDSVHKLRKCRVSADYDKEFVVERDAVDLRQLSYDISKHLVTTFSL